MVSLDLADPVLTVKTLIEDEFSPIPVAVNAGGDTRGGYKPPQPKVIPIEGLAGKRTKTRLNIKQVKELALIRLYQVSDVTTETSLNEDFGDRAILVSLEMTHWESKARLWELYSEIRRIVYLRKRTPGGNYRAIRPKSNLPKIREFAGTFQYIWDVELAKFGEFLGGL